MLLRNVDIDFLLRSCKVLTSRVGTQYHILFETNEAIDRVEVVQSSPYVTFAFDICVNPKMHPSDSFFRDVYHQCTFFETCFGAFQQQRPILKSFLRY